MSDLQRHWKPINSLVFERFNPRIRGLAQKAPNWFQGDAISSKQLGGFPITVTMNRTRKLKNGMCHSPFLYQSFVPSDRGRDLLQDEDHSASRPHSFPRLYLMRSGWAPEWFRSHLVVVGS